MTSPSACEAAPAIDAILMASGFSARFGGENKLLAPFRGTPLALHTIRLACAVPQLREIYLVYADPAVAALAEGTRCLPLHNPRPQLGGRESVRLGVTASTAGHYLFLTCDQPLLTARTVAAILEKAAPGAIVSPACGGQPGNPSLFSAAYRDELLTLGPGQHPRLIKQRHPGAVRTVAVANPLELADIDTPEALASLEAKL